MKYFNIFKQIIKNSDLRTIELLFELISSRILAKIENGQINVEKFDLNKLENIVNEASQTLNQEPYKDLLPSSKEKIFLNLILEKLLLFKTPELTSLIQNELDQIIEEFLKEEKLI